MVRGSAAIHDPGLNDAFKEGSSEGRIEPAGDVYRLTIYRGGKVAIVFENRSLEDVKTSVGRYLDDTDLSVTVTFEVTLIKPGVTGIEAGPSVPNDDEVVDAEIVD